MSELSYPERVAAAAEAGRVNRTRIITESWNGYLNDVTTARKQMPNHPDEIDVNHIIACRMALQASWAHLDQIEARLPAQKAVVRSGVEADVRQGLMHQLAFVGVQLGVER